MIYGCFIIFSLTKSKRNSALSREINSHKKLRPLRTFFNEPIFNTVLYQFSFLTISIKLLNSFIYKNIHIEEKMFRSAFEATILESYKANNKFWTQIDKYFILQLYFILELQLVITVFCKWTLDHVIEMISLVFNDIIITKFSVKFSSDLYFVSYIYIYIYF